MWGFGAEPRVRGGARRRGATTELSKPPRGADRVRGDALAPDGDPAECRLAGKSWFHSGGARRPLSHPLVKLPPVAKRADVHPGTDAAGTQHGHPEPAPPADPSVTGAGVPPCPVTPSNPVKGRK